MRKRTLGAVGLLIGSVFLVTSAAFAAKDDREKTKRQLQEEAKKAAEEKSKQIEQLKKNRRISEQIPKQQQQILQQQKSLQEALERTRVQANVVLEKGEVEAGSAIPFEFILTNGSQKTFMIDGRKSSPSGYEILDEKGKVIAKSHLEKGPPPKKEDLVSLKPGATLTPFKGEAVAPSRPGTYFLRGFHAFGIPTEPVSDVFIGSISALPAEFKIIGKKGK